MLESVVKAGENIQFLFGRKIKLCTLVEWPFLNTKLRLNIIFFRSGKTSAIFKVDFHIHLITANFISF